MKFAILACAAIIGAQAIDIENTVESTRYGRRSSRYGGFGSKGGSRGYGGFVGYKEAPVKARKVDYGSGFRIKAGRNVYNKDGRKA